MDDGLTISLREARALALAIFDRLVAAGVESVEIERFSYWTVFPADAFSVGKPEAVMADAADDLGDLRAEAGDPASLLSEGIAWHALHHLAGMCSVLAASTLEPRLDVPTGVEAGRV